MKQLVLCGALALAAVGSALAGTTPAAFIVSVKLDIGGPAICISQSLSLQANAIVRVACKGGEFVSITRNPNLPFVGSNGAAFQYSFASGQGRAALPASQAGTWDKFVALMGSGTITSWLDDNTESGKPPRSLLVTF